MNNNSAKRKCLQYNITNFAIEIGIKTNKEKYNKAWHKLWCRISKLGLFSIVFMLCMLCIGLSGCVYSTANLVSIQSDDTTILGGWGYVHCGQNSRVMLYRAQQSSNLKKEDMPSWPTLPNINTDPQNVNIGKFNPNMPKEKQDIKTPATDPSLVTAVGGLLTK